MGALTMAAVMPRDTAYIQEHVVLPDSHDLNMKDGELVWTATDADAAEPLATIKYEEIVFISEYRREDKPGYLIFSLTETTAQASTTENGETKPSRFKLTRLFASELPQEVVDKHLLEEVPEIFQAGSDKRLHVVVSTRSGLGQAQGFFDAVLQPILAAFELGQQGTETRQDVTGKKGTAKYELMVTSSHDSVKKFAQQLRERQGTGLQETIILLSGDGGIVDLLNGQAGDRGEDGVADAPTTTASATQPTIAILPLGTGNALFHSLHKPLYTPSATNTAIPSSLVLGLRTLLRGVTAPLPTFRASFSPGSTLVSTQSPPPKESILISHLYGAIVASYGFHAQLVWESDTPEYRKHGDKRFGIVAETLLRQSHSYRAKVDITTSGEQGSSTTKVLTTGKESEGDQRYNYVLAAMVSNLEKTFTISPQSKPLDGRLRLVSFGAVGGERTMEVMKAAYGEGAHVGMKWDDGEQVGYDEVEEVKVTTLEGDARWRKVCVDGTIVEVPEGGWMSVKRAEGAGLRVLVDQSVL